MLLGTEFLFCFVCTEYWVVPVGRIFNYSASPYDDG